MYFSEIVEQAGGGEFTFGEKSGHIFRIKKGPVSVEFSMTNAFIIFQQKSHKIGLSEFSKIVFKTKKADDVYDEKEIEGYLGKEKLFTLSESKGEEIKDLFSFFDQNFDDDIECSPKFQIESLIEQYELNETSEYNPNLYKLLLKYKEKMDSIYNEGILLPGSKIVFVLEEESGNMLEMDNLRATGMKVAKNVLKNGNVVGVLGDLAFGMAKSAVKRGVKHAATEMLDGKGIVILTDKNVILATNEKLEDCDFDEFNDFFRDEPDEYLANVVDIYFRRGDGCDDDDKGEQVLDNIAKKEWTAFKSNLRRIKKGEYEGHSARTATKSLVYKNESAEDESEEDEDGEMAEFEGKITKLRALLKKGIITQEDFDKKKAELLDSL